LTDQTDRTVPGSSTAGSAATAAGEGGAAAGEVGRAASPRADASYANASHASSARTETGLNDAARLEPSPAASARAPARASAIGWVALLFAVLGLAAAAFQWQRGEGVARETARRLQQGDERVATLEAQLRQSQELVRELQGRSAVLESKLAEAVGQQSQLEQMYRSIAQESLSSTLAEVENSVAIASQQLVVSANVRGALIAMQDADGRLKRINQPEALGLRRLIAADIERLEAVPVVDVVGLALRLDSVASALNQLPLLAGLAPPTAGATTGGSAGPGSATGAGQAAGQGAAQSAGQGAAAAFSFERLASTGRQGWQALLGELSQLFRVSRIDAPDALLLAPEQQYFVRENLRLTLLSARLALLARSEPLFRADLERAVGTLEAYFDSHNRGVANAVAALNQLKDSTIAAELPSLGDTLSAVRAARAAREGNS